MKQNEKDEFHKTNEIINLGKSVISNLFFGLMQIGYECLICKDNKKNYTYEIFRYITFSLNDIVDDENNKITIENCFKKTFDNNIYNESKEYYCHNCKKSTKCKCQSQIYQLPDILIILLKRGIKDVQLEYNDTIKTRQIKDNNIFNYDLYGVTICICNYYSKKNPTFIAACKNHFDNKWYIYEDRKVSEVNDFKKEVLGYKLPYILFYKRRK